MAAPVNTRQGIGEFFVHPDQATKTIPRLAVSLEAMDKCGKSHWALHTSPDPIAHVVINDNILVYQKAVAAGKRIHLMELKYPEPNPAVKAAADIDQKEHQAWILEWVRFKKGMAAVIADKTIRTVVWDTATELWHLAELAHFGKLSGNARIDKRTLLNNDYSAQFWNLYKQRPDLNIILIHRHKKQYVPLVDAGGKVMTDDKGNAKTEWNGKYERSGYNMTGFNVDMTLQCGWDGNKRSFYTRIDSAQATRFGSNLTGVTWYGEDSGFANLAMEVFPETQETPEYWGV
jgi:hypothetical protein